MYDTRASLVTQLANVAESLRLIAERKSEYVEATSIPLELIRSERELLARQAELQRRLAQLSADAECPYRALAPFDVAHAAFFFGRSDLIATLTAAVQAQPFVAVVGPSGSGKSSVVRAGLIPRLTQDATPWRHVFFTPRQAPLEELARALVTLKGVAGFGQRQRDIGDLAALLADDPQAIRRALLEIQADVPAAHLLLVADQFEELYAPALPAASQQPFITALLAAAAADPRIHVLIALRADFYNQLLVDPHLSRWLDGRQVSVPPLTESDLRAAIEEPAHLKGRSFAPGLVDRIVRDALGQPGSLPLLQFALTELWQRQSSAGELTHEAYDGLGGVTGALSQTAEAAYQAYARRGQQELLTSLFVRLVQPGVAAPDARRRVARQELVAAFEAAAVPIGPVVDDLVNARLLVVDRDPATREETVELAHEALVRHWRRLGAWVDSDREFLTWRQARLGPQLHAWEAAGHAPEALLRGEPLATALRWLAARPAEITDRQRDYVFHSILLDGRELAAWLPRFTPLDEALAFLDTYLGAADAAQQARGIAALRWVDAGEREAAVVERLRPLVLDHPSAALRAQAAQVLCERGQITCLTAALDEPLAPAARERLVDALAQTRNLPGIGQRVTEHLQAGRTQVRLTAAAQLIWRYRGECALVLLLIYLGTTIAAVLTSALWGFLFQSAVLPGISPLGPPALPLSLFDHIVALAALLYLFMRKRLVDGRPLVRRDRVLAAGAGSVVALLFAALDLVQDLGRRDLLNMIHGGLLTPAYFIDWLDTPLLTFLLLLVLTLALDIDIPARRLARHALGVAVRIVGTGIAAGLLLLGAYRLLLPNTTQPLPERFNPDGFIYPLLYGTYLSTAGWFRSTLMLAVSLAAFLIGLRVAFPAAFDATTVRLPERLRALPMRRLAVGGVLLVALLIFTSQVQPWRVGPLRLWCAVKWPERTASAVWRGLGDEPVFLQPNRDAPRVAELSSGECFEVVGRDATREWYALQLDDRITWVLFGEPDVEWLIQPARLPVLQP
jgi:energy-coupling factor transporter ATP-binding protein EcfA2